MPVVFLDAETPNRQALMTKLFREDAMTEDHAKALRKMQRAERNKVKSV